MAARRGRARPVLRLRIRRRGDSWTIEKRVHVPAMTLPASSPLPEGRGRTLSGFWYEATDEDGAVKYRRVLEDPTEDAVEVPGEDGNPQRVSVERPEVVFDVLVPDEPDIAEVRVFAEPKTDAGRRTARPRPMEPIARLSVREEPPRRTQR